MYCEQMMREQGFDDAPALPVIMYTDAIWRACRIILDVRMHRGEIGVDEAIRLPGRARPASSEPNAAAEVHRYTYTPTYQLSYLLGKVLLLRLRDDEQQRLGERFSLQRLPRRAACATAASRSASIDGCSPARAAGDPRRHPATDRAAAR